MTDLLTPEQVAKRLQVTTRTVFEWLRTGKLKGYKAGRLWRVEESQLEAFLKGGQTGEDHANMKGRPDHPDEG